MAPTLAEVATPTRFSPGFSRSAMLRNVRVPVTTTSAVMPRVRTASTRFSPAATSRSRRSVEKFTSRNVRLAGPAPTASKRYVPAPSDVALRAPAAVRNSTEAPGSTAPVSSRTEPVTAPRSWAAAGTATSAKQKRNRAAHARPATSRSTRKRVCMVGGLANDHKPPMVVGVNLPVSEDCLKFRSETAARGKRKRRPRPRGTEPAPNLANGPQQTQG